MWQAFARGLGPFLWVRPGFSPALDHGADAERISLRTKAEVTWYHPWYNFDSWRLVARGLPAIEVVLLLAI